MTSTWGTDRLDAVGLLTKSLNQTSAVVYDSDGDGGRVFNPEATLLAREKQQALSDRFATWIWEDPSAGRAARSPATTNCSTPSCFPPGTAVTNASPGLSSAFSPHRISWTPPGAPSRSRQSCSATPSGQARPPPWSSLAWR